MTRVKVSSCFYKKIFTNWKSEKPENIDLYIDLISDHINLDGMALFDPFGGYTGKFEYKVLSKRIQKIKEKLEKEFGSAECSVDDDCKMEE